MWASSLEMLLTVCAVGVVSEGHSLSMSLRDCAASENESTISLAMDCIPSAIVWLNCSCGFMCCYFEAGL